MFRKLTVFFVAMALVVLAAPAMAEVQLGGGTLHGYFTGGKVWDVDYSWSSNLPGVDDNFFTGIDEFKVSSPRARFLYGGGLSYEYGAVKPFVDYFALTGREGEDWKNTHSMLSLGTDVYLYKAKGMNMGIRVQYADIETKGSGMEVNSRFLYTGIIIGF